VTGSTCYINCRVTSVASPADMAHALVLLGLPPLLKQLPAALRDSLTNSNIAAVMNPALTQQADLTLREVLSAYIRVLQAWDEARSEGKLKDGSMPVLVLDEASALMEWSPADSDELARLLRFFVTVTKEMKSCHVVLATADHTFSAWLREKIGSGYSSTFVIGDLPEGEARAFLNGRLTQYGQVSDEDWAQVYQVCGGNAGALIKASNFYSMKQDWAAALRGVTGDVWEALKAGSAPSADAGYTSKQFSTAVQALVESPFRSGAVDAQELGSKLGGAAALNAMVKADLVAIRPFSDWAQDIEPEAFGPKMRSSVVTAATPVHLHLMREEQEALLAAAAAATVVSSSTGKPYMNKADAILGGFDDNFAGTAGSFDNFQSFDNVVSFDSGVSFDDIPATPQRAMAQSIEW